MHTLDHIAPDTRDLWTSEFADCSVQPLTPMTADCARR